VHDRAAAATPPAAAEDRELAAASLAGDERAFARLVERHRGRVAATVVGMLGPGPEADDVGQDVFIELHRSLGGFRGDAALGTWLTRIAINRSLDALRRRQRGFGRWLRLGGEEGELGEAEPRSDGHARIEARERGERVRAAVQRLKPEWRAVVVLRWLQGHSTLETAELLGIPKGTVLSRLSRALDRLRTELKDFDTQAETLR